MAMFIAIGCSITFLNILKNYFLKIDFVIQNDFVIPIDFLKNMNFQFNRFRHKIAFGNYVFLVKLKNKNCEKNTWPAS